MSVVLFINYNCTDLVDRFGWTGMAVIFGAIAIILLLITFLGTQERTNIEQNTAKKQKPEDKTSVGESFRLLFQNKYFWLLTIVFVVNYTILGVNNSIRDLASRELGLRTAKYFYAKTFEEFKSAADAIGFPCVVKPLMSSSGHGQSYVHNDDEIGRAHV